MNWHHDKSIGHVAFVGEFEYFLRDGDLYVARRNEVIMPDGQRTGRWECGKSGIEKRLEMLKENES